MKVKAAYYSKKCPGRLIVEMLDGRLLWGPVVPARLLQKDKLTALPSNYHCLLDYIVPPAEARAMYGLSI